MTAEINELFVEGITRSGELADAADEAMNAIDAMVDQAEGLAARVEEEGHEACDHLRDLVSRLKRAESELDTVRGQADAALEGLGAKAADLKTEVGELLERIKKDMAALEAQKSRFDDSLHAQMASTQSQFTELAEKTQEVEGEAEQRLEQAGVAIAAFRSTIEAARAEFAQKNEGWSAAVASLEAQAREQTEAWVKGLNTFLAQQAANMTHAANAMIDDHNETMESLRQRFVERAPQEVLSALEPLKCALERLGESATSRQQLLSSRAQELTQSVTRKLPVIETIRAVLEATAKLG